MAKLVNKQFNTPIGLYSQQNIQDVLDRESQILANGAVGIDFRNPGVGKPDNLKNSAVLRMLEEEDSRQRNGYGTGSDRILKPLRAWPPPDYEQKNQLRSKFKDVVTPGIKRVAWPPPNELGQDSPYIEQNSVQAQGGPQYPSQSAGYQQNNYPQSVPSNAPYQQQQAPYQQQQAPYQQQQTPYQQQQQQRAPLKLDVSQGGPSPLASPLSNQSPHAYRPATPSKGWAPVHSPVATPNQPSWRQNSPQAAYQPQQSPVANPNQPAWRQSGPQATYQSQQSPVAHPNQPAWRQASPTRFQAAHQPVSQQTFLGQQYTPVQNQPIQAPSEQYQSPGQQYQFQSPGQQYQSPASQQYQSPGQQYQSPAPQQYQSPALQQYQPPGQQYQSPAPQQSQAPGQQYQSPGQQYQTSGQQQTSAEQYSYSQQYQSSEQVYQSQPQGYSAPSQVQRQASKPVEPPPTTITLRPQAPVSQAPPPVYTSQPATANLKVKISAKNLRGDLKWPPDDVRRKMYEEAENINNSNSFLSLQGGKHLRGDLKWPPEEIKVQAEEENRLRLELAKGPVCRPRKVKRDYTSFFEQHALNSTYPGYKIPPGTQFYKPE